MYTPDLRLKPRQFCKEAGTICGNCGDEGLYVFKWIPDRAALANSPFSFFQ
jgi:hypothetical protein